MMKGSELTKEEQETIIIYNNADPEAIVSTYDQKLIRKLDDLSEKSGSAVPIKRGEMFAEYTCPKKWVRIQMPNLYTEEDMHKRSERMRKLRQSQIEEMGDTK